MRHLLLGIVACSLLGILRPAFADAPAGPMEEAFTELFAFPLSPGAAVVPLPRFDDDGGTRVLQEVTLRVESRISAAVTVENESALPAPAVTLNLTGLLTVDLRGLSTLIAANATAASPPLGASDGIDGSGPDFFDFGTVVADGTDTAAIMSGLDAFIGPGTLDAVAFGSGSFALSGTAATSVMVSNFMASGKVTVVYRYRLVPTGACCFSDGSCVLTTDANCVAAGGVYQGEATDCGVVACPQPGACCFPDGSCVAAAGIGGDDCTAAGGVYQGDDTDCAGVACPQPGACCFADGSCALAGVIGGADCVTAGGVYQGNDSDCATVACPQPGACCFPDGSCALAASIGGAGCVAGGGVYQGNDTTCVAAVCPQ
ncbi:MAG: choice-of-anchor E domain-containing protein, partial [Phycisphaerae bacterium]|nr:choice-of-anchor E domain-containing protein [Phycisphaerae bacterium]